MKRKILFTADWHLCNGLPHSRVAERGETDRLHDQLEVLRSISAIAKIEKVDAIFVLGDIFERRLVDGITLSAGINAVMELSVAAPVFILPGNHDANSSRGGRYLVEAFDAMHKDGVSYLGNYDLTFPQNDWGVTFYPVAWGPLSVVRERIAQCRVNRAKGVAVLLMHQAVNGCTDGGWLCDKELDPKEVCEGFDLVLSGHFHEPQEFGDGIGYYIGAPMEHDFRDANSVARGVMIVKFKGNDLPEMSYRYITSPRFHTRKWNDLQRDPKLLGDIRGGDYLRIDVRATHTEWRVVLPAVEEYAKDLRAKGIHVLPPKHDPIAQSEDRIVRQADGMAPSFEDAIDGYINVANTEGLDKERLAMIAKTILREATANG